MLIAGCLVLIFVAPLAAEQWAAISLASFPALLAWTVGLVALAGWSLSERHRRRSLIDGDTGLPNARALLSFTDTSAPARIIVARIDKFEALAASLGPTDTATLVTRTAERIATTTRRPVYRADEQSLAWIFSEAGDPDDLDKQLRQVSGTMRAPIECGRMVDVTLGIGVSDLWSGGSAGRQHLVNAAFAGEQALR